MIKRPWDEQIRTNPDQLWTGDFSMFNLANSSSGSAGHLVRWYKTKNDLIDAMILRLNELRDKNG